MKKILLLGLTVALMFLGLIQNSFAGGPTPNWKDTEISKLVALPMKINIVPPSADLPPKVAAFSYRWEGIWSDINLPIVLLIEKIKANSADIIYCGGHSTYYKADYNRIKAQIITGEKTKIEFPRVSQYGSIKFTFEMGEDLKTLYGKYQTKELREYNIIMKKIED